MASAPEFIANDVSIEMDVVGDQKFDGQNIFCKCLKDCGNFCSAATRGFCRDSVDECCTQGNLEIDRTHNETL